MLQQVNTLPPPSEIEKRNPKTVSLTGSGSGTVLYTVPTGRVFRGRLSSSVTGTAGIAINGVNLGCFYYGGTTSTVGSSATQDIMLVGGDQVSVGGSGGTLYIVGVEYDA